MLARGVPVRSVGAVPIWRHGRCCGPLCLTIGAILSTALLMGRPHRAQTDQAGGLLDACWSGAIGMAAIWLGVLLAYDSFYWPPVGQGWPVSFFVVALIFVFYLAQLPAIGRAGRVRGPASQDRRVAPRCSPASW